VSLALLVAWLAALAWFVRDDLREYAAFKALTETHDRQKRFRAWLLKALLLFVGGGLLSLALMGRLAAVILEPDAFLFLTRAFDARLPMTEVGPGLLGGLVSGLVGGVALSALLAQRTGRPALAQLGDVEPLMPRNTQESLWAVLLSLNAGVGEELVFRLVLPLLIATAFGSAAAGFLVAGVAFGAVHLYQGWKGVAATTAMGFLFAGLYLWTGSLAAPIALHVILDVLGLAVRPALVRAFRRG
jgi:membrane protease YdiL (CAAX protease family)